MKRSAGYLGIVLGVALVVAARVLDSLTSPALTVDGVSMEFLAVKSLTAVGVAAVFYGLYVLVYSLVAGEATSKRRRHNARNVLRLVFGVATVVSFFGILTEQWIGLLFSFGVIGVAVTFALQQPLFSLIGWFYIMLKRPYQVGDRVAIEGSKGDVVDVDFFVTTLWEMNGELVTTNQPSGRIITLPNSVVLSSHVYNYSWEGFPYVWNELAIQVAYETDLAFASETMRGVADDYLGAKMRERVGEYRDRLAETPVELEVNDGPSVNVVQKESWVELRLRYLVHPRRGQRVRNDLYREILDAFNDHPERVKFPVGRSR
ncbi:mechanosensitive ion channel family protein [Haloplanus sp. GCM10025708]|uniref:mechanosensitive ion channel family protein n=1 Tax=Haloferacaceae TaxID=1644056 RepID=UPI003622CE41